MWPSVGDFRHLNIPIFLTVYHFRGYGLVIWS